MRLMKVCISLHIINRASDSLPVSDVQGRTVGGEPQGAGQSAWEDRYQLAIHLS